MSGRGDLPTSLLIVSFPSVPIAEITNYVKWPFRAAQSDVSYSLLTGIIRSLKVLVKNII